MPTPAATEPAPVLCGAKGLCPRCGARTLYDGLLAFAPRCARCGLDFSGFNVGDGPAAFLTTIIGTLVCIGAIALALTVNPPWWVQALLWVPVSTLSVIGSLRLTKGWLLALEYRNSAREGRQVPREP